jgi:hypothetical protein
MTDGTDAASPSEINHAPPTPSRRGFVRSIFGDFTPLRVVGGFVLIFLVTGAAACAVTFFAAAQFQSRVAELSLNGAPMTI